MSDAIYPALPGLTWSVIKSPIWKTRVQTSVRGRELRIKDQVYPRWKFQLVYSFLRGFPGFIEVQTMMQFFQDMAGSWDTFLFEDPSDNVAFGQPIGVGNGVATNFQLARRFTAGGSFIEPIIAPIATTVYVNGVPQNLPIDYSVDTHTGVVTFAFAPANARQITADLTYRFRCRFTTDTLDFEQFMKNWWELKKVEFESVLL